MANVVNAVIRSPVRDDPAAGDGYRATATCGAAGPKGRK
ncbi:hypothetical protein FHX40_4356 [Thermopolyspora flexuosa]|uniref:Uncharacterized protein n=1 Tax=Thermopolyspora flexuosa TaxID=103836 RepID=A0A543J435_9ACTN|nr:hypothetical protein FHX40_4356 [Thermopolyspora flexuosa]